MSEGRQSECVTKIIKKRIGCAALFTNKLSYLLEDNINPNSSTFTYYKTKHIFDLTLHG